MKRPASTPEEIAAVQQAIGDAADDWVQEHEDDVPFEPPADETPSDYGQHAAVVSQTPEQHADYWQRVQAAAAAAQPEDKRRPRSRPAGG